jgi:hypothetical protein
MMKIPGAVNIVIINPTFVDETPNGVVSESRSGETSAVPSGAARFANSIS